LARKDFSFYGHLELLQLLLSHKNNNLFSRRALTRTTGEHQTVSFTGCEAVKINV
jgi:hypothetical protein